MPGCALLRFACLSVMVSLGSAVSAHGSPAARGMELLKGPDDQPVMGQQHLFIIGINRYLHWNYLQGAVGEAQKIKGVLLARYAFTEANTVLLLDEQATRANIIGQLRSYGERLQPEDSLLIIYCGHGHKDTLTDAGFWIPTDGGEDQIEQANWIPNSEIRDYLKALKAHHVLVIADSCFSGRLLTRELLGPITEGHYRRAYGLKARQILTSGADEPVTDQSDFGDALYDHLSANSEPYIDALGLYDRVRHRPANQQVLFGQLADCGHETGGSYVFFLKVEVHWTNAPPLPSPPPQPLLDVRQYLSADSSSADPKKAQYKVLTNRFETLAGGDVRDTIIQGVWRPPSSNEIYDWNSANQLAARLGGRLPTLNELKTLISRERERQDWGLINSRYFPAHRRTTRFWTGDKGMFYTRKYVDFRSGTWGAASESEQNAVLVLMPP